MKNSKALFREIIQSIALDEPREEIESIAFILLADIFGIDKNAVLAETAVSWEPDDEVRLNEAVAKINSHEPVQYVVGSASFYGRKFLVNNNVLIPRPETEELVSEVLKYVRQFPSIRKWRLLDVGTGTGCIPVTLAEEIPETTVMGTDVSEAALAVARQNVIRHRVPVQLLLHNILTQPLPFRDLDIIVSNPPYIPASEMSSLDRNVVDFEPHLALFVASENPLLFYEAIAASARDALVSGGRIFFETHEAYAQAVADHLSANDYDDTRIIRDISGKPRVVTAVLP